METQASISQWAAETFGPVSTNVRVAIRAHEEMSELLRNLSVDDHHPKAAEEAADVMIVLYRLATRLGYTLTYRPQYYAYRSNLHVASDANVELGKAIHLLVTTDDDASTITHLVNVRSLLFLLAHRLDVDLLVAIDQKMAINRQRQWHLDGSGHGYHVRDKE